MKKQTVPAILILILSLVILIGSQSFLSPCIHEDGSVGACHWAGQMCLGLGCVLVVITLFSLCVKRACLGVYLSEIFVCVLGAFTPGTLIDLCHMSTMRCRMEMQPAMMILFSLAAVCALIGVAICVKEAK